MYDHDLDLEGLLSDPLVRLVMASDGVEEAHIRMLAKRIAPRQATGDVQARSRFTEAASGVRHTPSCRKPWAGLPAAQPST